MDKFNEAWKNNRHVHESAKELAKSMFDAGQDSLKQGYLDVTVKYNQEYMLRKELERLLKGIKEYIEDMELSEYENDFDKGYDTAVTSLSTQVKYWERIYEDNVGNLKKLK